MDSKRLFATDHGTVRTRNPRVRLAGLAFLLLAAAVLSTPGVASAQEGEWHWQLHALAVIPQGHSEPIADLGTVFTLGTTGGVGFEADYGLTHVLALDLSVAASRPTLRTSGGTNGGLNAGTVWLAPVTVALQYRPSLYGPWHPYVGLGVAYGQLFGYSISEQVQAHSLRDLEFKGSFGLALQAGVLYDTSERWFVSASVADLMLKNEVTLIARYGARFAVVDMKLDHWQIGFGVGHRF